LSITERAFAAAVVLGGASTVPYPKVAPRYVWSISQDAGAPDASAGDAGLTPEQRAAEIQRAIRAFKDAASGRKETSQ
jgi:hypothetical protein